MYTIGYINIKWSIKKYLLTKFIVESYSVSSFNPSFYFVSNLLKVSFIWLILKFTIWTMIRVFSIFSILFIRNIIRRWLRFLFIFFIIIIIRFNGTMFCKLGVSGFIWFIFKFFKIDISIIWSISLFWWYGCFDSYFRVGISFRRVSSTLPFSLNILEKSVPTKYHKQFSIL